MEKQIREATKRKYEGKKYNRLTILSVIKRDPKHYGHYFISVRCDCGKEKEARLFAVTSGSTKSCGCYGIERTKATSKGNTWTRLEYGEAMMNTLFYRYKKDAARRNLSFELTKDEFKFITKQDCFFCGKPPSQELKGKSNFGSYIYNGIDRADNSIGYQMSNCIPCCIDCNSIKNAITRQMIEKLAGFFTKQTQTTASRQAV